MTGSRLSPCDFLDVSATTGQPDNRPTAIMGLILPFIVSVLVFLFLRQRRRDAFSFPEAVCGASIITLTAGLILTEMLSAVTALTPPANFLTWSGLVILTLIGTQPWRYPVPALTIPSSLSKTEWLSLMILAPFVSVTAVVALAAPPNTWDALTYHLPRVEHWLQNRNLSYFPTANERQNVFPPGAEILILQTFLLSGNDHAAPLVQWMAYVGSLFAAAGLTARWGLPRSLQLTAAVLTATLPMAVLQATSAQTDLLSGFAFVCFLLFLQGPNAPALPPPNYVRFGLAGMALGLAGAAKGLALVGALPFLFGFLLTKTLAWKQKFFAGALIAGLALLIIFPSTWRLHQYMSTLTSPPADIINLKNQRYDLPAFLSNILRGVALHANTSHTPFNRAVEQAVNQVHVLLGISPKEPRTTFAGSPFHLSGHPWHEDHAGQPVHLLLIATALLISGIQRRFLPDRLRHYGLQLGAAAALFFLLIKFQPFATRLQLPLFLAAMPWTTGVLATLRPTIHLLVIVMAGAAGIPALLFNESRPLIGPRSVLTQSRWSQLFTNNPGFQFSYDTILDEMETSSCHDIGWIGSGDAWEYPLWVGLRQRLPSFQFRALARPDGPALPISPNTEPPPCLLITDETYSPLSLRLNDIRFTRTHAAPFLNLYRPDPNGEIARRLFLFYEQRLADVTRDLDALLQESPWPVVLSTHAAEFFRLKRQQLQSARSLDPDQLKARDRDLHRLITQTLIPQIERQMQALQERDTRSLWEAEQTLQRHHSELLDRLAREPPQP